MANWVPAHDCAIGLHNAMARAFRRADYDARLGVLCAHPDLAGKLAAAKRLTYRKHLGTSLGRTGCLN
jgi:2-oxo-4-hydroxy-4-carboxy--5-ureidoimidazoline (OHCU) decarboxylase